jgi:hypothetical protein
VVSKFIVGQEDEKGLEMTQKLVFAQDIQERKLFVSQKVL